MAIFINPFVDRGFKLLFGREDSKALLIDLLNDLLEGERAVVELSFMNVEAPADCSDGRNAVFDLKCKDKDGTVFIVEVQNSLQTYFYERGLYYLCRMICDQDRKGEQWDFSLCPVYGIFFLNFKSGKNDKVRTDIVLADRETGLDYWLYTLKYMEQLKTIPFKGQKALFERLEKLAKIVNLNKKERMEYEECLKVYRDNQNTWDYAIEKGYQEGVEKGLEDGLKKGMEKGLETGLEKGVRQVALNMKRKGMEVADIMECTGLDAGTIAEL